MSDSTCSVPDCNGATGIPGTARGMCSMHYNRWRRNGDPLVKTQRKIIQFCEIAACGKPHDARGLCSAHISNLRRHGTPTHVRKGAVVNGRKICGDCNQDLPIEAFYTAGQFLQPRCKPCASIRAKAYRDSRPAIARRQYLASAARRAPQRRDAARKRRAVIRAVRVEHVESQAVFEQASWVCGICDEGIPRITLWPHPLSASLDHIIPLASGGEHSYANTQPAHLACNMSKGARPA